MKKLVSLVLIASIVSGCASAGGGYTVNQGVTSPSSTTSSSTASSSSSDSFWTGTTIFWTVLGIVAVGAAAKKASDKTCYTGPRGGTYTITASGNKNYSGC
jgi:hypothetical protein